MRIHVFFYPLFLTFLLVTTATLHAEQSNYLARAIDAFVKSDLAKSRTLLAIAQKKSASIQPDSKALRLEALLVWSAGNNMPKAQALFVRAFDSDYSSSLAYFLGNYFLDQRRYEMAGIYFAKAARSFKKQENSKPRKISTPSHYTFVPIICPQDSPVAFEDLLDVTAQSSRMQKKRWDFLSKPITLRQALLAAYQAYVLLPGQKKSLLALSKNLSKQTSFANSSADLLTLLLQPDTDKVHATCILHITNLAKQLQKKDQKQSLSQILAKQKHVFSYLSRAYFNRMLVIRTPKTAYDYGNYLLQTGQYLAALHVFRQALKVLNIVDVVKTNRYLSKEAGFASAKQKSRLLQLQQILFALHYTYQYLKRSSDVEAVQSILSIIETSSPIAVGTLEASEQANRKNWIKLMISRCRSLLYNREALVLLVAYYTNHQNKSLGNDYQAKLKRRDKVFAEKELTEGYAYLRRL